MISPKSSDLTHERLLEAIKAQEGFINDMLSEEFRTKESISDEEHVMFENSASRILVKCLKERIRRLEEEVNNLNDINISLTRSKFADGYVAME